MPARATIQLRAVGDGGRLNFHGVASAYERAYEMWDWFGPYTEVVSAGAGADSLARADLDVPLVLQHQSLRRIARTTNGTLTLRETDEGLEVDAPELDPNDKDVEYIAPKIDARLIDEMSFMFRIELGHWSPNRQVRHSPWRRCDRRLRSEPAHQCRLPGRHNRRTG